MAEAKKPSKKEQLLVEAKKLKLSVTAKNTVAQIQEAIAEAQASQQTTKKVKELVETEAIAEAIVETEKAIDAEEHVAKAGKHSAKSLKEAAQKAAKEDRKASAADTKVEEPLKPKAIIKARPRIERQGKKFREAAKLIDKSKEYPLNEAMDLAAKTNPAKFDATVELHVRLGVDPRQADQNVRATVVLPAGSGKTVKVAVFGDAADVTAAKKAGADIASADEFLQQLDKNVLDFDVLIATPAAMPKLGKYARVLGPKGLMPSPKSGTVTTDIAKAVTEAKAGRVEYRVDSTGIVHLGVGKVSFGGAKLLENTQAVLASIRSVKPASIKGNYILSMFVTTSMGPSIKITTSEA